MERFTKEDKRTHYCGTLTSADIGKEVAVLGWCQRQRDLGSLIFIDLRDRTGIVQLAFDDKTDPELFKVAFGVRAEYVLAARGVVRSRGADAINKNMATGEIEIAVHHFKVLSAAQTPPFEISDKANVGDETALKYRYLDLRRPELQRNILMRHEIARVTREYYYENGFIEIETPMMIKPTPEGARDYLVPSRIHKGSFYALPQSPQIYKQLLMLSGFDRYIQLARCFRDEDLRADRQPEFTQIDCEMSFVEQEDVLNTFEGMMRRMFKNALGVDIPDPLPRMRWYDAMDSYGSDKPDVRFGMKIHDITTLVKGEGFSVFDSSEYVGAIAAEGCAEYTRKQLDELTEWVKRPQVGAKGLVYIKLNADGSVKSSVDKFFSAEKLQEVAKACEAKLGDLILVLCGAKRRTQTQLGVLRIEMGGRLGLRDPKVFAPLWIVDFPLLEWSEEDGRFYAMHHPFTAPKPEHEQWFYSDKKEDLERVCANAYDFVLNGTELGGGSIRIHDAAMQSRMFDVLGISREDAEYKFGFITNAFKFGAPPHGGLAFGFDRVCALFGGQETIRDYIAFPKNNQGRDVMIDSPSKIDQSQMDELYLQSTYKEQ